MKKLITLISIVFMATVNSFAYITITNDITSNTTWTTGNTYFVEDHVQVHNSATLTIQEGVVVKFGSNKSLYIYGQLQVNGTGENNVFFTSMNDNTVGEIISGSTGIPSFGEWGSLMVSGDFNDESTVNMSFVEIKYAKKISFKFITGSGTLNNIYVYGLGSYGLSIEACPELIANNIHLSHCMGNLSLYGVNTDNYTNVTIDNITHVVIVNMSRCLINTGISEWNITAGTNQYINVHSDIYFTSVLPNMSPIVYVFDDVDLDSSSELTIMEGCIIKVRQGDYFLSVEESSTLNLNGTSEHPIIITSFFDDEYGGDTNGDGSATSPQNGDWKSLFAYDGAEVNINYCWLLYGGYPMEYNKWFEYEATICFDESSNNSSISNSRIENSTGIGIRVVDCSPDIQANSFQNNDSSNIVIEGSLSHPNLGNSLFAGGNIFRNTNSDNINNTTTNPINAINNDWGSADSTAISQQLGNNDPTTGTISFSPWFGREDGLWYDYDKAVIENSQLSSPLLLAAYETPTGTTIIYKTGEGRYGKMKILERTGSSIDLWWETYNADGSTYSAGTNLHLIASGDGSYCDLDRGMPGTYLNTPAEAEFYLHSNGDLVTTGGTAEFAILCFYTTHSGGTSGSETWGEGTHYVTGSFTINGGDTLFIEPGAIIKFASGGRLTGYGTILALGSQFDNIYFTSANDDHHGCKIDGSTNNPQPGDWQNIRHQGFYEKYGEYRFCNFMYGGTSSGAILTYSDGGSGFTKQCTFEQSSKSGLKVYNSDMTVDSCTFQNNAFNGILYDYFSTVRVNNSNFFDNGEFAILTGGSDIEICQNNQASGNLLNGMVLISLGHSNYQILDNNWNDFGGMPFIVYGTLSIVSGKSLYIGGSGGTLIKMNTNAKIQSSGGHLNVFGATITSIKDDSIGGDSNNDGNATSPAPGDWQNIYIQYDHDAQISQSYIYYGGSSMAAVYFANGAGGNMNNADIKYSLNHGIYTSSSPIDIWACDISENTKSGVFIYSNDSTTIRNSDINNNGEHGIEVAYSSVEEISGNDINNNGQYPVYFTNSAQSRTPISNNEFDGNLMDAVVINSLDWYEKQSFFEITGNQSSIKYSYVFLNSSNIYSTTDTIEFNTGSVVKFSDHIYLQTKGKIFANNTVFTSIHDDTNGGDTENNADAILPAKGDWSYVEVDQGGEARYDYCNFCYGGYNNNASVIFYSNAFGHIKNSSVSYSLFDGISKSYNGNVEIRDNTILANDRYGINVYSTQDTLLIDGNQIQQSGSHAINLSSTVSTDINNNTFENNGGYPVYYTGTSTINDQFTGNTSSGNLMEGFAINSINGYFHNILYPQNNIPFIFLNNITSYSTTDTLEIQNSTVVKFFPDVKLKFKGPVIALGGILTSIKDDSWGGDTNNDADATSPTSGDWRGVELYYTWGHLNGIVIRFAGANSTPALHFINSHGNISAQIASSAYDGLSLSYASKVEVSNSFIIGNTRYGINTYLVDTLSISNSNIQGNGSHGIYLQYSNTKMRGNTIIDNTGYGINNHYVSTLDLGSNDVNDKGENIIKNNDSGNYQLYNNTANEINAYYNDWGYTTAAEIDAHIYDDNEDGTKGEVHFNPWYVYNLAVGVTAILEGPFNGADMDTDLNSLGLLPLTQPFNTGPWNYAGTESVATIPNTDVVDWVLLELRDATDAENAGTGSIIDSKAGFLLKDGSIVETDGASTLSFAANVSENLFVVVHHRNHLEMMSANALTQSGGVYEYDFSTGINKAYGNSEKLVNGKAVMFGGDMNADESINLTDKIIWANESGTTGYLKSDISLNGQSDNKDKNNVWVTNNGEVSQVPE